MKDMPNMERQPVPSSRGVRSVSGLRDLIWASIVTLALSHALVLGVMWFDSAPRPSQLSIIPLAFAILTLGRLLKTDAGAGIPWLPLAKAAALLTLLNVCGVFFYQMAMDTRNAPALVIHLCVPLVMLPTAYFFSWLGRSRWGQFFGRSGTRLRQNKLVRGTVITFLLTSALVFFVLGQFVLK